MDNILYKFRYMNSGKCELGKTSWGACGPSKKPLCKVAKWRGTFWKLSAPTLPIL